MEQGSTLVAPPASALPRATPVCQVGCYRKSFMKGMASEVGGWEDVKGKRTERPRAHTTKWRK